MIHKYIRITAYRKILKCQKAIKKHHKNTSFYSFQDLFIEIVFAYLFDIQKQQAIFINLTHPLYSIK